MAGKVSPPLTGANAVPQQESGGNLPPIATQCFMLSNMFDPINER